MRRLSVFLSLGLAFSLGAEETAGASKPEAERGISEPAPPDSSNPSPESRTAELVCGPDDSEKGSAVPSGLTIAQAEELLNKNNLTVIAARYGVDNARAAKVIAAYHPNPSMIIAPQQFNTAFPKRFLAENNTISASQRSYTFEFDLPIETAGKRRKRVDNAVSLLQAADAQVLDALRNQIFQMKTLYYSAVLARENERVAAEVLASVDNTEALIKRQVAGGATPEAQLITFQANRIQFEQALITAQLTYDQSIRDLLNILAARPEDVTGAPPVPDANPKRLSSIVLAGDLNCQPITATLEELRQKTETRSDVVVAQRNLDAAERNLTLSHALKSPDFTVGTQYVRTGDDNTVGMSFNVPLPLFNHKEGEIGHAEAQLWTARTLLKQAKLQALTDVDKAFRGYELNQQVLKLYDETTIKRAKEALDIAEKAYTRGGTSLLEVLDARRTYRQTLVARDQARFTFCQSVFQLEQASGVKLSNP